MAPPRKKVSKLEREFAELIVDSGLGPIESARKVFGWKCEPKSREAQKAQDLARTARLVRYITDLKLQKKKEAEAERIVHSTTPVEIDLLKDFIYKRLRELRDDTSLKSQVRYNAALALEKIADPSKDTQLVMIWLSFIHRGMNVHCPSCHNTFPMWKVQSKKVKEYIEEIKDPIVEVDTILDRRLELLVRSDLACTPHPSQIPALAAPERHIAGLGPARSGKSQLLSMFAFLGILIPGCEIWIVAQVYESASKEVEYLRRFLNTIFHPYTNSVIREHFDSKTGELTMETKWGSILQIRSAKSKGSITAREVELALVAEPGWVPDDIWNHLRARIVTRLGRIIMLGTPQGYGGILGRFINAVRRDPKTKRLVRVPPEQRTIASGMDWDKSLLLYHLKPEDNPTYVKSELEAARMELLDSEYATEFEGQMASAADARFQQLKPKHLIRIGRETYQHCVWILGIDQGPRNFGWCLIGWDGQRAYVASEDFDSDERTMKYKMMDTRQKVKYKINALGGDDSQWIMTVFDTDPPITNELREFEDEGKDWPTDVQFKHRNLRTKFAQEDWRKEIYEWINGLCVQDRLFFDLEESELIHNQLIKALIKPGDTSSDLPKIGNKGWVINDAWRGDHVPDAFVMAMWTIYAGMIKLPEGKIKTMDPYAEAKAAFEYKLAREERRELSGYNRDGRFTPDRDDELFEQTFGRKRKKTNYVLPRGVSPYKDY